MKNKLAFVFWFFCFIGSAYFVNFEINRHCLGWATFDAIAALCDVYLMYDLVKKMKLS